MYCPQCGLEYREGFTECSDCHVPLAAGSPPPDPGDPNLDLVVVLETNDRVQLSMAQGLLRDAEIPFFVLGRIAELVTDVDPFLKKWEKLQVPRDREAEAREVLDPVLHPETVPPDSDAESESI